MEAIRKPVHAMGRLLPEDSYNEELIANVHPPGWKNPEPAPRYNLVVIGAGTAGLVTAAGAAGLRSRPTAASRMTPPKPTGGASARQERERPGNRGPGRPAEGSLGGRSGSLLEHIPLSGHAGALRVTPLVHNDGSSHRQDQDRLNQCPHPQLGVEHCFHVPHLPSRPTGIPFRGEGSSPRLYSYHNFEPRRLLSTGFRKCSDVRSCSVSWPSPQPHLLPSDYFFGTALGIIVGVFIFTFFVGTVRDVWASGDWSGLFSGKVFFSVALFAFSFFIPKIVKGIKGE